MKSLFIISMIAIGAAACSSAQVEPVAYQPETICYEDDLFHQSASEELSGDDTDINSELTQKTIESKTKHCSNKPRTEHILKDMGYVQECRNYYTSYRMAGRTRHVKGLLCKNANGEWSAVDQRYSYFN